MKTHSLLTRAAVTVLAIEFLCAVGLASSAIWHERELRFRGLDATLAGRSDSLAGAVQDAEDPQDNVKVDPEEFTPRTGDQYSVYNPNGRLVGTSGGDLSAVALGNRAGTRNVRAGRHAYRVLQRDALRIIDREETGGVGMRRPITVVYAVPSDHIWHEVLEGVRFYILITLASVAVTAFLLIMLAQKLLQPLNDLASAAGSVRPPALHFEPSESALSTKELRPLAETLALVVTGLRHAFETERRFIGDAAHELKTAVAVVRSSIQVLALKPRSAEGYRKGLDRILEDNQRVENLIGSMLTLAGTDEAGQVRPDEIDFADTVERSIDRLATFAESKQIMLCFMNVVRGVKVRMQVDELESVVSNIVINAVQHSAKGSSVLIDASRNEQQLVMEVCDVGEGISAENLPYVFDRFFREDPSRSRETGGAGLGLSISKSIVERAGGTIEIKSQKGVGTRVTVCLLIAVPNH